MRYYFDIRDNFYASEDDLGVEMSGVDAARQEAVKVASSIAGEVFLAKGSEVIVRVRDQERPLFEVALSLCERDLG